MASIHNENNSHLDLESLSYIMIINLSELQLGEKARIISFEAGAACRQKMFACGLLPNAEVSVVRVAPLGDPMQIRLDGDIMLSIRKAEGRNVKVEVM